MGEANRSGTGLSGRVRSGPADLLHEEVLGPQFAYEVRYLLPHYIRIEQVLIPEYQRMGLLSDEAAAQIRTRLREITPESLTADPSANFSDIAFAIERYVEERLTVPAPAWHVDRSRNDLQACAQLLLGRDSLLEIAAEMAELSRTLHDKAAGYTDSPMPGYTHFQSAQVISPGFYLAAFLGHLLRSLRRLLRVFDEINLCPLGAGAMAGQELPWDRERMADLLGFAAPQPHALTAVASREWVLLIGGELSLLGAALSRFATDFIHWGGSDCRFISLPDELSGISSAMPQKKNYPILERIRGKTAHLSGYATDFLLGQRNTPYSNLVEVSKEAGANLMPLLGAARSSLRLFTAVAGSVQFHEARMREACEREFFGGFTLANQLTLAYAIPYRKAQVIAGRFIARLVEEGIPPDRAPSPLLEELCQEYGYPVAVSDQVVRRAFDAIASLRVKGSAGSVHPDRVRELLAVQAGELQELQEAWGGRRQHLIDRYAHVDSSALDKEEEG